jgi:hypothetical protein
MGPKAKTKQPLRFGEDGLPESESIRAEARMRTIPASKDDSSLFMNFRTFPSCIFSLFSPSFPCFSARVHI